MLRIWTTWWTIDKKYGEWKGIYNFDMGDPIIGDVLSRIAPDIDFEITELMRKDSLDMDKKDRNKIAEFANDVQEKTILLTHGTDTVIDTAHVIKQVLGESQDKVIVLLWAAQPYTVKGSDAEFNIWFWLWVLRTFSQLWKSGIYLCMNGEVFPHDEVEKCDDGVFRKITKKD